MGQREFWGDCGFGSHFLARDQCCTVLNDLMDVWGLTRSFVPTSVKTVKHTHTHTQNLSRFSLKITAESGVPGLRRGGRGALRGAGIRWDLLPEVLA